MSNPRFRITTTITVRDLDGESAATETDQYDVEDKTGINPAAMNIVRVLVERSYELASSVFDDEDETNALDEMIARRPPRRRSSSSAS